MDVEPDEYRVRLDHYDGPLDLLLYLIDRAEVDIRHIPIAGITEQFLAYVGVLREVDLQEAGNFLVMASTLMEIKSRMILPGPDDEEETGIPSGDPRSELVSRLLEYQRLKGQTVLLEEHLEEVGRRYFPTVRRQTRRVGDPVAEVSVWDLLTAYSRLAAQIRTPDLPILEDADETPVQDHMNRILELLANSGTLEFQELFPQDAGRAAILGTFLALLELIRLRRVGAVQETRYGPILLRGLVTDPDGAS